MSIHELLNQEFWSRLLNEAWSYAFGINGLMLLIFWGIFAFAVALTYLRSRSPHTLRNLPAYVLPPETLHSASARADFLFWLSRRIFMPLLVLPTALSTVTAGHYAHLLLGYVVGSPQHAPGPLGPWQLVVFTVTMFLAYDLSYYIYHLLQHRVPFMWELHKVHHSAEVMIGVTKDRVHPLDEIMNRWWDGIIPGVAYGVWLFFGADPVELTIFGLNVYFLRNTVLMMDFVRHTHLKLSYGRWLNYVLLCPHYHQLHHSVAKHHWDKNFGLTLSIWDRMFGTLVVPKQDEDFVFGLPDGEAGEYQSLVRLHILPLKKIAQLVRRCLRPRADGLLVPTTD
jgi:sterol desaturase/sphingolipid hydroxylase (fatty acid hydroxylase superfamily)